MYKKMILLLMIFSVVVQYAYSKEVRFDIKPSYFLFAASPMHDVYDAGGFEIQSSVSVPLSNHLDAYGSIGYRQAQGHALNTFEKTSLSVIPVDLGLKPVFDFAQCWNYFFAVGPRYFYLHQQNNSPYVDYTIDGSGIGFFVNTGLNVVLADAFLLGIFGEYSYEKKGSYSNTSNVFSNGSIQIGGIAFGLSIGYAF